MTNLSVSYDFLPKRPTAHTALVMSNFGIGFETGRNIIAENLELPVEKGEIVCFTGASGSGKSSLMRALAQRLDGVVDIDSLELPARSLIDGLGIRFPEAMKLLSLCGLSEPQLMLRSPAELSDGQRYRYRLAFGLSRNPAWLLADEFTAALDRTLAKVIVFNLRKLADRTPTGFLLATAHEDVVDDLSPDLHVTCDLGGEIGWERRERKKKSQLSGRVRSHDRNAGGLAVLRSVALPQSQPGSRAIRDGVMARGEARGDLRVRVGAADAGAAEPVFRHSGDGEFAVATGAGPTTADAVAGGDSSGVSRVGDRGGVRAAELRVRSAAVDRSAGGDGVGESVFREGGICTSGFDAGVGPLAAGTFGALRRRAQKKWTATTAFGRNLPQEPIRRTGLLRVRQSNAGSTRGSMMTRCSNSISSSRFWSEWSAGRVRGWRVRNSASRTTWCGGRCARTRRSAICGATWESP